MICVTLVEEHATKEPGDGSFTSSFLQVSVLAELLMHNPQPLNHSSCLSLGLRL